MKLAGWLLVLFGLASMILKSVGKPEAAKAIDDFLGQYRNELMAFSVLLGGKILEYVQPKGGAAAGTINVDVHDVQIVAPEPPRES